MFENMFSTILVIMILLGLVVLSFVIYELIKPSGSPWTAMLSGIVEWIQKITV